MIGYPLSRLYEEVAYIAHHLHWSRDSLLSLEHAERRRWAQEAARFERSES